MLLLAIVLIGGYLVYIRWIISNIVEKMTEATTILIGSAPDEAQQETIAEVARAWNEYGDGDHRKLAYILATLKNENNFRSVQERRCQSGTLCYQYQQKYWDTGYYGRGLPQLTWKGNYQKMSDVFGIDFVNNPDLVLNPKHGANILVYGMMNGSFSGKRLSNYINDSGADYVGARWVVNGQDKATTIAGYAQQIEKTLV